MSTTSGGKKEFFKRKTTSAMNRLYNMAASYAAEANETKSKGGVAAGTAASLLSLGIDRMGVSQKEFNERLQDYDIEYDGKGEILDLEKKPGTGKRSSRDHFIDSLIEKLVAHALPSKDKGVLQEQLDDRNKAPNLSIRLTIHNFKKLSAKLDLLFQLEYGLKHVLEWKYPVITLLVLMAYTSVCFYPHLVLVYPLLYVTFGIMGSNFLSRHPIDGPLLVPTSKRDGDVMFGWLHAVEPKRRAALKARKKPEKKLAPPPLPPREPSPGVPNLPPRDSESLPDDLKTKAAQALDETSDFDDDLLMEEDEKIIETSRLKSHMQLLINMRDLQNLTSDLISLIDQVEKFWYGKAAFVDERESTQLFINLLLLTILLLIFGAYIPWSWIFAVSGWLAVAFSHPEVKSYVETFQKKRKVKVGKVKSPSKSIVIDEAPTVREVEVFELEERGLTAHQFKTMGFASDLFGPNSSLRAHQKKPLLMTCLKEVYPPKGWRFCADSEWKLDRGHWLDDDDPSLRLNEEDNWCYDDGREYRRRRWIRICYRYSKPPNQPHA